MKLVKILLVIGAITMYSCKSSNSDEKIRYYSGTIEPTGITSYQYGTHILESENDFYALKSDVLDLTKYENQEVEITASKIEGYPVDGGPVYLLVTKVKK